MKREKKTQRIMIGSILIGYPIASHVTFDVSQSTILPKRINVHPKKITKRSSICCCDGKKKKKKKKKRGSDELV